jgi:hypothetical protein
MKGLVVLFTETEGMRLSNGFAVKPASVVGIDVTKRKPSFSSSKRRVKLS